MAQFFQPYVSWRYVFWGIALNSLFAVSPLPAAHAEKATQAGEAMKVELSKVATPGKAAAPTAEVATGEATTREATTSKRYAPRRHLLGYPPYPMKAPLSRIDDVDEFRKSLRFGWYAFEDITPAQADEVAARFRREGLNLMMSENNRYLFNDEKTPPLSSPAWSVLRAPGYEKLIANTKIMVDACHRHGLRFFHHLTCVMVGEDILRQHPDWAAIDLATGKTPVNEYGTLNACFNNGEFMDEFLRRLDRLQRETNADGLMQDEIQFLSYTQCSCPSCRAKFKHDTGLELPKDTNTGWFSYSNPQFLAWLEWRRQKVRETHLRIRKLMKKYGDDKTIITYLANNTASFNYYSAGCSLTDLPLFADSIGYECEPPGFLYPYYWGHMIYEMKYMRAVAENAGLAPWTLFYNRTRGDYTWNWLLAMSQGSRVWWEGADPKMADAREPLIAWEARHQELLTDLETFANIGVPFSMPTRDIYPNAEKQNGNLDWMHGFSATCNALTDAHLPYRVLNDEDMTAPTLKQRVKTLLLFGVTNMSERTAAEIRHFVREGGTLIASAGTSLYDELGRQRTNFALADLFGFDYDRAIDKGRMLHIDAPNAVTGNISGDLAHPESFVVVKNLQRGVKQLGAMIAPDGGRYPGLLARDYGKGKVVYFAGHPEYKYLYWYYNEKDIVPGEFWKDNRDAKYGRLIANVARYANAEIPVEAENLPQGVVLEAYRRQRGTLQGVQVHLANFLGGRVSEGVIPLDRTVSFPDVKPNLPQPQKPISLAVRAGQVKRVFVVSPDFDSIVDVPFHVQGEYTRVSLPTFYRYAIVYFSQGDDSAIMKFSAGKLVKKMPSAKPLRYEETMPLVGAYDAAGSVAFAGTPAITGGVHNSSYKEEECISIYGTDSEVPNLTATLDIPQVPVKPILEIGGMDDNRASSRMGIEIKLNGKIIFSGKNDFPDDAWAVRKFPVEGKDFVTGKNTVEIGSLDRGIRSNPPWFALNFIRVRGQHN